MNKLIVSLLVFFALTHIGSAESNKDLYKSFDGKYPSSARFFENKDIKRRLVLLTQDQFPYLKMNTEVQSPMDIKNGFLVLEGTGLNEEKSNEGIVVIDINKDIFYAGLLRNGERINIFSEIKSEKPAAILNWINRMKKKTGKDLVVIFRLKKKPRKSPVYKNHSFGYAIIMPDGYKLREFPKGDIKEGADLVGEYGTITVRAMPTETEYEDTSFDDYVQLAATVELQNYISLSSSEPFETDSGIKGYKTVWNMTETVQEDRPDIVTTKDTLSGPIYYFPLNRKMRLNSRPVKTIMVSFRSKGGDDGIIARHAQGVARSLEYN